MANETGPVCQKISANDNEKTKSNGTAEDKAEVPELIQLVNSNDINGVEKLLVTGKASVQDRDSTGMTALMHSAFKGNTDMCKMLLNQGSDPNAEGHSYSYYPLHFAALSSSMATTQMLLDKGAKTYKTNSVGRTAGQMAGFVGHSACVALIANHVDRSELQRYTCPTSPLQTTTLAAEAEQPLYEYIMQVNLHPVHLTMMVSKAALLMRHLKEAAAVLHHLSIAETKRPSNVNEVLSIKFHYLGYLLDYIYKELNKGEQGTIEIKEDVAAAALEGLAKQFLRCRSSDGAEVWQEIWLRDAIKSFHCVELPLFLQVVRSMAGKDVQALSILSGAINGQRGFADEGCCAACAGNSKDNKSCSKCKAVHYCNRACQKLHWSSHKKFCGKFSKSAVASAATESPKEPAADTSDNGKENNKNATNCGESSSEEIISSITTDSA